MWEFIKGHPFLFGALGFFFLLGISLGIGLTMTGIFAPFGLTILGLVGAGALLFAVTFIPMALILSIALRRAWRYDQQVKEIKETTDSMNLTQGKHLDTQAPSSGTPTPGQQVKDKTTSTTATTSTSQSSVSSSSASTGVTEEEARRVLQYIMRQVVQKKLLGHGLLMPPTRGNDDWGLTVVRVGESDYKLVLAKPEQAVASPRSPMTLQFKDDVTDFHNNWYDASKESGKNKMIYCPAVITDLIASINTTCGKNTAIIDIQTQKLLHEGFYTYRYGLEIPPTEVKRIFATLPPEQTEAPKQMGSTITVSSTGPASPSPSVVSLPASSTVSTTSTASTSSTTTVNPAPPFSKSPLSPPPSTPSSASSSSPVSLVATKEQAEKVREHMVKKITDEKLKGYARLSKEAGGNLIIETDKNGNCQIVYSPRLQALDGITPQEFVDGSMPGKEGYDASEEPGNTRMIYCPSGLLSLTNSINQGWGKNGQEVAKIIWNIKVITAFVYTYEYRLEISTENVKRIFDTLPPPTQTPGSPSPPGM